MLNGVRRGTQGVLVELKVHSRQPGSVGYRALVIDPAKAF
ncbi:arylsulfotransferase [Pseudomonas monteilii SB3101]|uniref:Arylsulfotransferase n=1 Tax=Pseudomonas monteilii SB3101 TaxID=1435058 RepID=V9V933_9PSED|nr:arylsulfotransferase [Pseudomonas putida S16]AHC85515.1 arylsulfotransferase [Pseudomonas monteilii SB3078]AHC90883.1 arylsulfotransferase [Pseudomonas monteilii SB3101]AHZ74739.1 arylsulfotransferase [Pseudomonas putida]KGK28514.1 arylsulfotransferase [Pseudomonas plecoglossicida]